MGKMMVAPPGTYGNPADKYCWKYCTSCGRCENKGMMAACVGCSGRFDPKGQRVPDIDDYCRCKEGVLQWKTQEGRLVQVRMRSNPFAAVVKYDNIDQDESDWESYLNDAREKLNDPNYDPVQFTDGTSTTDWARNNRSGAGS